MGAVKEMKLAQR